MKHDENFPSIIEIKKLDPKFAKAKTEDIKKIIDSLDPIEATGPDDISIKVIKIASKVVDSHLTKVISRNIELNRFSDLLKVPLEGPIYKKEERC